MTMNDSSGRILATRVNRNWVFALLAVIIGLILWILCLLGIFCLNDPDEGGTISQGESIQMPIAVAFYDANPQLNQGVKNVTVTLVGDELDYVRTSAGTKMESLLLSEGVMSLGILEKKDGKPIVISEDSVYRFRLKAEAPGYLSTWAEFVLTDGDPVYRPIYMVSQAAPPSGSSVTSSQLAVSPGGVLEEQKVLITDQSKGIDEQITLTIPKGTRLMCVDGQEVDFTDEVEANILFVNPFDSLSGRIFPNGFEVTEAFDSLGNPMNVDARNPGFFTTAGWFTAEITVGGNQVTGFSKPLTTRMEINRNLINPEEGRPYEQDDEIPLFSLDDKTGVWFLENTAVVQEDNGKLFAEFKIQHLSTWNLDFMGDRCGDMEFTVSGANGGVQYYLEVFEMANTSTGSAIKTGGFHKVIGPRDLSNGTNELRRVPADKDLLLAFYRTAPGATTKGNLLGNSNTFSTGGLGGPCVASPVSVSLVGPTTCGISIQLQLEDPDENAVAIIPACNNAIWYKSGTNCTGTFQFMGILADGSPLGTGIFSASTVPATDVASNGIACLRFWLPSNSLEVQANFSTFQQPSVISPIGAFFDDVPGRNTTCAAGSNSVPFILTVEDFSGPIPTCP